MEQKLPIHKYGQNPLALFMNPMAFSPLWWNDEHPIAAAQRNMNRMFSDVLDDWKMMSPLMSSSGRIPSADVSEDRKCVRVKMPVPGLEAEDIDISVEDGMLTISAEKQEKKNNAETSYSFSQSLSLPEEADVNRADVTLNNHMLTIEIPKMDGQGQKLNIRNSDERQQKPRHGQQQQPQQREAQK